MKKRILLSLLLVLALLTALVVPGLAANAVGEKTIVCKEPDDNYDVTATYALSNPISKMVNFVNSFGESGVCYYLPMGTTITATVSDSAVELASRTFSSSSGDGVNAAGTGLDIAPSYTVNSAEQVDIGVTTAGDDILCYITVAGVDASGSTKTVTLTEAESDRACATLSGVKGESTITTVPSVGTDDTDTYPLYTAEAGTQLSLASGYTDSSYQHTYTAAVIKRDFSDNGDVDWTHLEEYEGNPQTIAAAGSLTLKDGAYCVEIRKDSAPLQGSFIGSTSSGTVLRFFVRVGSGLNVYTPFADVAADSYYFDSVLWAVDKGITNGTSDTTFSPDATCTRGQIITFLWRAAGSPLVSDSVAVSDVSADDYYYNAVQWAYTMGMTSGSSFDPSSPCTRGMTVDFMWKAAGCPNAAAASFTDVLTGSQYAAAVAWALEQGVTSGTSDTTFSPDTTCTRSQVVTFLYRAAQ